MGIYKEETFERFVGIEQEYSLETVRTCVACLWSFLVSMTGGLILGFWEYRYHPTNSQLWMVPFSLILLVTPLIVWFAVFVSDHIISNSNSNNDEDNDVSIASHTVHDLVHDPEK